MEKYLMLFRYYKQLGDKALSQVPDDDQLFWTPSIESNCIAVIVQHLHGNMKSRWTDFLTTDGEKDWRNREQEFELYLDDRKQIIEKWEEGWTCLFSALESVRPEHHDQLVYIRNKGHTIDEAVHRQLAHYAYHVGQLVFLSRLVVGQEWSSLSIPRGESKAYNEQAFQGGKRKEHFTEEFKEEQ